MNVLILANPYSGTGPNRRRVDRLVSVLDGHGVSSKVHWTYDDRVEAMRQVDGECKCIVAAGGDGSIADVVNDMDAAGRLGLPFATLPVGNENLFAQEFGFTGKPERIASAIVRGQTRPIDLGSIEFDGKRRLFTLMVSAGFDADVVHRLDRWRKDTADGSLRRVKRSTYLPLVLSAVRGYGFPSVTLEADGQTVEGGQAYVFNLPRYGGKMAIGKRAVADDGLLDWVVFEKPGFMNLLGYHGLVMMGKHLDSASVAHGRSRQVSLRPSNGQALPAQTDGDPSGQTPVVVGVLPQALKVIAVD